MVGRVTSQLNHYETLGVPTTAGSDEIARAFAREGGAFRPHAFGGLTELCIAYETLRDPDKRRAYDASLGIKREPALKKFQAAARQSLVGRGVATAAPRAAKPEQVPGPQPKPALPLGPAMDSQVKAVSQINRPVAPRISLEEELGAEVRPIDWRQAALLLGGVVTAACAVGGAAGWWSASAVGETSPPENTVSVSLPPAKPQITASAPEIVPAPVSSVPEARDDRPMLAASVAAPPDVHESAPRSASSEVEPRSSEAEPAPGAQATDEVLATSTTLSAMPLPDRVVARTIERIGYSCGKVASAVPVEGEAPGVFKVTCSSGQSYQASPVNGRYRFRRWGRS